MTAPDGPAAKAAFVEGLRDTLARALDIPRYLLTHDGPSTREAVEATEPRRPGGLTAEDLHRAGRTLDEAAKRVHVLATLDEGWEALRGRVVHWGPLSQRQLEDIGWADAGWCRDPDEGLALGLPARSVEAAVDADLSSLAGPTQAETRAIVANALARMPERQ